MGFLNRPLGGFLGGSDDEITHAPALDFGGPFHDQQGIGCNAPRSVTCDSIPWASYIPRRA